MHEGDQYVNRVILQAVSYTNLDVYKRQVEDCAQIARIIRSEVLAVGQGPEPEGAELPVIQ